MINYFKVSKFFLYLVPLGIMIVTPSTLFPFIVGKYVWFRTGVGLALIFFLLGLLFQDKLSVVSRQLLDVFKKPLVIAVFIFAFIFVLAGFFGVDPLNSFWSNFERGEGGLQMIYLWLFFMLLILLFREEKDWQKMFIMAIIGGIGMAFYGFMAGIGSPGFIGGKFSDEGFRFAGSIGNPAYVAAYAIFMMFYSAYLLIGKYRNRFLSVGAITLFSLIVFFLAVFWLAATRGALLGLIAALIVFAAYIVFSTKKLRKWILIGMAAILLIIGSLVYLRDTSLVKSLPGSRIFDISFSAETFQHRTIMWQIAVEGWKERPFLGWGPENYLNVFDRHFNTKYFKPNEGFGAWFDRAHSIYFDYLVETGILGLLSFLGIFGVFYWQIIKFNQRPTPNSRAKLATGRATNNQQQINRNKQQQSLVVSRGSLISNALIFALPVAYLVQGIVLFDVLPIYLNNFLFLAFAVYKFSEDKQKN